MRKGRVVHTAKKAGAAEIRRALKISPARFKRVRKILEEMGLLKPKPGVCP